MTEPETHLTLEAPGGLINVVAQCKDGKAQSITVTNVKSFVDQLQVPLHVEGLGEIIVDTAYGGDSFVMVDAEALGVEIKPENAKKIAELGMRITAAANEQLGFTHPENADWDHISFCQFMGPIVRKGDTLTGANAVAIRPGKIDRSPTGTGCSARMALMLAKGEMGENDKYIASSILGSKFNCDIAYVNACGDSDPSDPWQDGYRLSDTWPMDE